MPKFIQVKFQKFDAEKRPSFIVKAYNETLKQQYINQTDVEENYNIILTYYKKIQEKHYITDCPIRYSEHFKYLTIRFDKDYCNIELNTRCFYNIDFTVETIYKDDEPHVVCSIHSIVSLAPPTVEKVEELI